MSLFKKNGNWFIRYRDENGIQRQVKAGELKSYAQALERKILTERNEIKHFGAVKNKDANLEEALAEYFKSISIYKSYYDTKTILSAIFRTTSSFLNVKQITKEHLISFLKNKNLKTETKNTYIKKFKAFLNFCKKEKYIREVPEIKLFKSTIRVKYLTKAQFEKLLEISPLLLNNLFVIAAFTGMRKNEIFSLKWNDIDFENRFIHINESKTHTRRDIPIHDMVLEALEKQKNDDDFVFPKPPSFAVIRKYLDKAGLADFHFHDLRHTFASWLAMKGVSLQAIKELLGHSSINMTLRYAHLASKNLIKSINVL